MTEHNEEVLDSPTDWVADHIRRYVENDGRDGHMYQQWPTLLLSTRGRKSGKLRLALIYGQEGDRYLRRPTAGPTAIRRGISTWSPTPR